MIIPDMGARKVALWLREYASRVSPDKAIVEVGAWLGAGTRYLLRDEGPLYVYDKFCATQSEVEKADKFGVRLIVGQDTLPWVKSHLPEGIHFVKGNIRNATYDGPKIGLYVDDASKAERLWNHSMETFEPYFVKGTVIVLMDYHFPPCHVQRKYARKWNLLVPHIPGTSCAVFSCG